MSTLFEGGQRQSKQLLKLARQYFLETGQPGRKEVIARRQSYHGNTLGALAVGGNEWRRSQFAPMLIDTHHIEPCYAQREKRDYETDYEFGQHTHVGDIRDRGLCYGLEIVEERKTKEPFSSSYYRARKIKAIAKKRGLLCYPMSGTIDGKIRDHILLAPPYFINEAEINELIGLLVDSLAEALQSPEDTM